MQVGGLGPDVHRWAAELGLDVRRQAVGVALDVHRQAVGVVPVRGSWPVAAHEGPQGVASPGKTMPLEARGPWQLGGPKGRTCARTGRPFRPSSALCERGYAPAERSFPLAPAVRGPSETERIPDFPEGDFGFATPFFLFGQSFGYGLDLCAPDVPEFNQQM